MAKGGNTVAAVKTIVAPIAEEMGLSLWDITFSKEGSQWYLRIFIEREGGTSINDCVDFTKAINGPMDDADPIEQAYMLEVCSPGIERELTKPEHFEAYIGMDVMLKTIRPVDGQRDFKGILESYSDGNITVRTEDERGFTFTKKEVAWVKADDFEM